MILIDTLAQGLLLGGLYALFAAGLSLVFGIMRLVNLAHGDLIILAAYLILTIVTVTGLHPFLAVLLAAPVMFAVGWLLQTHLLNRVLGTDILPPLLVTFGLSVVIQNSLLAGYTADSRKLAAGTIESQAMHLGPVTLGVMPVLTFASAVAVIFALNQLFYRTALGRAFRATSDDTVTAQLMGIQPQRVFAIATGIALVVATIAALFLGTRANFDRRPRQPVGNAGRRHRDRSGTGDRRVDQSRMANPVGPYRLCACPSDPSARAVPARQ